jgi:uncharacterized protein YndB with AHSA1/START domain
MTAAAKSNPVGEHALTASRIIRAPRARVFEAWLNPAIRRRWWLNSKGQGPTHCEIDGRVGGRYCIKQVGCGCETELAQDDDYEWVMTGEFLEISAPERIVFSWSVNHEDEPVVDQRVTVEFREVDGGTEVTIHHVGIVSTTMRDGTNKGWNTMLENIARVLE